MRKPIFDAARAAGADFNKPGAVATLDDALDRLGVPRDSNEQSSLKAAVDSIKDWEGCRLTAYPDPGTGGAPWTIGFGSTRDINGAAIKPGTTWTLEQAEQKLAQDVAKFGEGVSSLLGPAPTTASQWAAMVSFAYNVGLQALKESTLLRKHKEGDYEGAAHEFLRWTKAAGKEHPGLVKRRDAESKLYRGIA